MRQEAYLKMPKQSNKEDVEKPKHISLEDFIDTRIVKTEIILVNAQEISELSSDQFFFNLFLVLTSGYLGYALCSGDYRNFLIFLFCAVVFLIKIIRRHRKIKSSESIKIG